MTSLFLGIVASGGKQYEIHALTKDLPFREFSSASIADRELYQKLLQGRFKILEQGKPIYCTAITPDVEKKIEENPHDSREGTVHIVAVAANGEIAAALSVAVDIGQTDNGRQIGLPLENIWKSNGYPEGASLNSFRQKYLLTMYGQERNVEPWEMAELYRHYKLTPHGDMVPRLAVYSGWYHLGLREAKKKGRRPTWLWVFDAVPSYFNLYKLIGKAVLRDLTIEENAKLVSPSKKHLRIEKSNGFQEVFYKNRKISRPLRTLIPKVSANGFDYHYEDVPFLDGLVDMNKLEDEIKREAILTPIDNREGFSFDERFKIRMGLGIAARRAFEQDYHPNNVISNIINRLSQKQIGAEQWVFSHIGSL